jgi:hypothetical protein
MGIHLFCYAHGGGEDGLAWCCVRCFCGHCKRCGISYFMKVDPCPLAPYLMIFASIIQHYVINQWCLHISRCCHHQHHSNWFSVVIYSFLWDWDNNCSSGEGWSLSWLVLGGHVFPSSYKGLWMSTPTHRRVFSSMCQHGVRSEGHWRPSSLSFARIL